MKLSKLFLLSLLCCSAGGMAIATPPNLGDDLGGGYHETPNLDFTDVEIDFGAK